MQCEATCQVGQLSVHRFLPDGDGWPLCHSPVDGHRSRLVLEENQGDDEARQEAEYLGER